MPHLTTSDLPASMQHLGAGFYYFDESAYPVGPFPTEHQADAALADYLHRLI